MSKHAIAGSILGTAVADAIGLPYEALSRRRGQRLFGVPDRHRFLFGRGMGSDDTEHTCLVAQALCVSGGNVEQFRQQLAWGLRWWLMGLPAGIGFATLRAILRLWLGYPPTRSGVWSAGNGPAMRCAVIGAAVEDTEHLYALVCTATQITHTDPRALAGALCVALAARQSARGGQDGEQLSAELGVLLAPPVAQEWQAVLGQVLGSVKLGESNLVFADTLGCKTGVSGFVLHTVPVAMHIWLSHPRDYAQAVSTAVRCGGDTDTLAAIVGGIVGAGVGTTGIPKIWLDGLWEWPRSQRWMDALATQLAQVLETGVAAPAPAYPWFALPLRNALFAVAVLAHVLRRVLPPY